MSSGSSAFSIGLAVLVTIAVMSLLLFLVSYFVGSTPFKACTVNDTCLLNFQWHKFDGIYPPGDLTSQAIDESTDTVEKAQAWVISKLASTLPLSASECKAVVLVYPKVSTASTGEFTYGQVKPPLKALTSTNNATSTTYILASVVPTFSS
jgi:hypothetical protein